MANLRASRAARRVVTFSHNLKLECPDFGYPVNEMDLNKSGLIERNDCLVRFVAAVHNWEYTRVRVYDAEPSTGKRTLRL